MKKVSRKLGVVVSMLFLFSLMGTALATEGTSLEGRVEGEIMHEEKMNNRIGTRTGEVVSISETSFVIKNREGKESTINVTDKTKFKGVTESLNTLEVGNSVLVNGKKNRETKVLEAVKIKLMKKRSEKETPKFKLLRGIVKSVDAATNTVVLTTEKGEFTLHLTTETKFAGLLTLQTLKVGQKLMTKGKVNMDAKTQETMGIARFKMDQKVEERKAEPVQETTAN